MPRKVKQKQKQKQSQTVIVNIGRGKRSKQARPTRQPPPSPQFIPYPVPSLRGPDQMVTPQPTLIQMLEALRPIQAPVVPAPVAPIAPEVPPIVIPEDEKVEAGPVRAVGSGGAFLEPSGPLVDKRPISPQYEYPSSSSASSASSSLMEEEPRHYTHLYLSGLNKKDGVNTLMDIGRRLGIKNMGAMLKAELIAEIMKRNPGPPRERIPRPKIAPREREKTM